MNVRQVRAQLEALRNQLTASPEAASPSAKDQLKDRLNRIAERMRASGTTPELSEAEKEEFLTSLKRDLDEACQFKISRAGPGGAARMALDQ